MPAMAGFQAGLSKVSAIHALLGRSFNRRLNGALE